MADLPAILVVLALLAEVTRHLASFFALTAEQVRSQMTAPQGGLSEAEFDTSLELLSEPSFIELAVAGIAVIGRKPS